MNNLRKKALILYPNLHMMLVPSVAVGIFTTIYKNNNFDVELFDIQSTNMIVLQVLKKELSHFNIDLLTQKQMFNGDLSLVIY